MARRWGFNPGSFQAGATITEVSQTGWEICTAYVQPGGLGNYIYDDLDQEWGTRPLFHSEAQALRALTLNKAHLKAKESASR